MYFRLQQKAHILNIKDDFAYLSTIANNGDLEFEFTYSLTHRDVINNNAQTVMIDVESRHIVQKPLLGNTQRGQVDTKSLVDNIRTSIIDAKSAQQQQLRYTVASRASDVTSYINSDVVSQLRGRAQISQIPAFNKPRLNLVTVNSIKESNDPQPLLHRVANSSLVPNLQLALTASSLEMPQTLIHDMIIRQGLDPTYSLTLTPRAQSAATVHGGLLTPQTSLEKVTDPATRLLHSYLFPSVNTLPPTTTENIVDTDLVHVLQTVSNDTINSTETIVIPFSKLKSEGSNLTQLYVTFNLIDSKTGTSIDTVVKILDLTKHLQIYRTPKLAPIVKATTSEISSRVNLEIKQIDKGATEVQLYKKSFWTSSNEIDDYTLIGTYALTANDQSLLVQVDKPINSPAIYRVIPVGQQSTQGFEFTNVVITATRYRPVLAVSLTAVQVDTGIQLEVRHLPTNAVAIQFLRWNLTTNDTEFTIAPVTTQRDLSIVTSEFSDIPNSTNVGFIDDSIRQADLLTTIDTEVTQNNVYSYVARVIYKNGSTNDFGDVTIEFIKPSPGQVDTRINNLIVSHDVTPNVTFEISTNTIATDIDAVKDMLERQGLIQFFQNDVQLQRDQLTKLIAHNVYRVDLKTGERENFGVLTVNNFDDNALRKNQAIKPLVYGHRYRYEIYPLLRSPETMFDGYQKTVIDTITKKPYTFSPAKFLHPFTLSRGVIVTSNGAKLRQAKDPMTYGVIGSIVTTEVSFDQNVATVTNAIATNFDKKHVLISWKILGDLNQVDHFVILKQVHGIRSTVGKTHAEFMNGGCQYIHPVTNHDVGSLNYVIIPIFSDYKVGAELQTNTLIIEAS